MKTSDEPRTVAARMERACAVAMAFSMRCLVLRRKSRVVPPVTNHYSGRCCHFQATLRVGGKLKFLISGAWYVARGAHLAGCTAERQPGRRPPSCARNASFERRLA